MRTPKRFYAPQRIMYPPALLTCPHWGDLLVMCTSLAWDKTVQTLEPVLAGASRPGHGPHVTCAGARMRLLAAQAQRLAPSGATYGSEVLGRLAWWRPESREIPAAFASQIRLSASHVGSVDPQVSRPLLACHERQHHDQLAQMAKAQGGWISALDGLAPQGGEPPMWFIRALTSGFTRRSGWLAQQDQPPFAACLKPLTPLEWPILAGLSDKPTGLVPAVAAVLPTSRSQVWQAPSLRNRAAPLAEAEAAFKVALRHTVRQHVGALIRQEPRPAPGHAGVLTLTGRLPSPPAKPTAPASPSPTPWDTHTAPASEADEGITPLLRPPHSLRPLQGRPPFRLAGRETYERLQNVARLRLDLLATRYASRLAQLSQGRQAALAPFAPTDEECRQGAAWLRDLAYLLAPTAPPVGCGAPGAEPRRGSLDTVGRRLDSPPTF